jgi:hypothetical protein
MRILLRTIAALLFAPALLLAAGCSSDDGSEGSSSPFASGTAADLAVADPVQGEVAVTFQNLDPSRPAAIMQLVNESSEVGQKLKSGKATSAKIKVLTDAEMGGLLAQLEKFHFFEHATDGLGLDNIPDLPNRKGIVVVTQDGHSRGVLSVSGLGGGPIPKVFVDSKRLILDVHAALPGSEIRAGIGEADERIFSAPPPPKKYRR